LLVVTDLLQKRSFLRKRTKNGEMAITFYTDEVLEDVPVGVLYVFDGYSDIFETAFLHYPNEASM
jgi:hypothetical protein